MKPPSAELHPQVQTYLHELHVLRQLSPHTIKAYQADLSELYQSAQEDGLDLTAVTNSHIRRWAGSPALLKANHPGQLRAPCQHGEGGTTGYPRSRISRL
jgi:site-specific recombinase XerD